MPTVETIREPARETLIFRKCDVLVVGGGPAGCAAAASAARLGADTVLVERFGHLGGMSTGGLVLLIVPMTDWSGRQVIAGFADDILGRLPEDARLAPPSDAWGSRDPRLVDYWEPREAVRHGIVTSTAMVDPEMLKIASNELLLERGVKLVLHSWAVAPVQEGSEVRGVIFESKSGRRAILARVVIDATGDGDIFALAGAPFETNIEGGDIHSAMTLAFRLGGVDMDRYSRFRREHQEELRAIVARGTELGVHGRPWRLPRNDVALFMTPYVYGRSCIDVEDLTTVEVESRRLMLRLLEFYRKDVPGFEAAWVMDTAPQMGVRHSRRLVGVKKVTRSEWVAGLKHQDEIGVTPTPDPRYPSVSIPLGCLTPVGLDNLLAAGRNLCCDPASHVFLRLIPQCWVMGQAAGVAAAVAADSGVRVRDVDVKEVRQRLLQQGVYLQETGAAPMIPQPGSMPEPSFDH